MLVEWGEGSQPAQLNKTVFVLEMFPVERQKVMRGEKVIYLPAGKDRYCIMY